MTCWVLKESRETDSHTLLLQHIISKIKLTLHSSPSIKTTSLWHLMLNTVLHCYFGSIVSCIIGLCSAEDRKLLTQHVLFTEAMQLIFQLPFLSVKSCTVPEQVSLTHSYRALKCQNCTALTKSNNRAVNTWLQVPSREH